MSFAGAEVSWNRQSPEVLYGSYYDWMVQHTISRRTKETGDMLSAKIHASQGFDWRRLKIGASVTYSYYDSPLLVQDEVLRYYGNSIGVNADLSLTPFKWLGVNLSRQLFTVGDTAERLRQISVAAHCNEQGFSRLYDSRRCYTDHIALPLLQQFQRRRQVFPSAQHRGEVYHKAFQFYAVVRQPAKPEIVYLL